MTDIPRNPYSAYGWGEAPVTPNMAVHLVHHRTGALVELLDFHDPGLTIYPNDSWRSSYGCGYPLRKPDAQTLPRPRIVPGSPGARWLMLAYREKARVAV